MQFVTSFSVLGTLVVAVTTSIADAESVTHTVPYQIANNFSFVIDEMDQPPAAWHDATPVFVQLPLFDPSSGTLTRVELTGTATATTAMYVAAEEYWDDSQADLLTEPRFTSLADTSPFLFYHDIAVIYPIIGNNDGPEPWQASVGEVAVLSELSNPAPSLGAYEGIGSFNVRVDLENIARMYGTCWGDVQSEVGGEVSVTYYYTPN